MTNRLRLAGAIAITVAFAGLGLRMTPPYLENWRFGQELEAMAERPDALHLSDSRLQALAAQKGAAMGLPVLPDQVRIERAAGGLRIEARYQTVVDLGVYVVNLHMTARGP